jgi:hypothetical protein
MTTAPYDPRSGNTPDARPSDVAGSRYQAQEQTPAPQTAYDPRSGNTPDYQYPTPYDPTSGNTPDYEYPTEATDPPAPVKPKRVYTYTDEKTGDLIDVYDDDSEIVRTKGTKIKDAQDAADALSKQRIAGNLSAFDILKRGFAANGLESLVEDAKSVILNEDSDAGRLLALRNSPSYQTRFAANAKRIANGFKAIDEGTYLELEDAYQSIAQNFGMPEKYYKRGALGVQQYFEEAIAKNIDPVTFQERIVEGVKVLDANKTTLDAAKQFYPTLTDGDFLEYVLNPKNALADIKRKVAAAEIGGAQLGAGLQATAAGAESLAQGGVTGAEYQKAATDIAQASLRGGQLAAIYQQDPYTQQMAEQVQLNIPGSVDALRETEKIAGLEGASFKRRTGLTGSALSRDRAGAY